MAEKTYLGGLKKEPEADVLRLECLETLMKLHKAEGDFVRMSTLWQNTPIEELQLQNYYSRADRHTRHLESGRSQALELLLTLRTALLQLEQKLEIQITWTPDSPEWKETQKYLQARTYWRALSVYFRKWIQKTQQQR
ncbi:hypothetical protein K439DRAFT_1170405 [Ramaria rubella]|nr:hypothetical protein K439DRAFT_1170405 [Ramaria rubella]